jgi:hypothetical protein
MPHTDETFYKMAVGWTDDPKVVALGRFGTTAAILARDLFSQMIGYSRRNLTDGLVPAQEVGRLMYPLPVELAEELAGYLADPGPFGALCGAHTNGNAPSNADSNAASNAPSIVSWVVLNYAKWNDTAADVLGRKAQGRQAAKTRWAKGDAASTADGNAGWSPSSILNGDADGIHRARGRVHTEQEQEKDTPLPPARNDARRTGRATTARGGGTRTPPPARAALADAHRPGGPTQEVHTWAAKARAGITRPDDPATGDRQEPLPEPPEPAEQPAEQEPPEPAPAPEPEEPAEDEIPF